MSYGIPDWNVKAVRLRIAEGRCREDPASLPGETNSWNAPWRQ
jgi:hypothetical protein